MKESDYILVTDLTKLRIASRTLSDVLPSISKVVDQPGYALIMAQLDRWIAQSEALLEAQKRS